MANVESDDATVAYLIKSGMATSAQIEAARREQTVAVESGTKLQFSAALVKVGAITEAQASGLSKIVEIQQRKGINQLGKYKLVKKLGEGAMGAVYLAEHVETKQRVALKALPTNLSKDEEFLGRFRREARATTKLQHQNIIGAIEAGEEFGHYFYVMEYFEGESLDRTLEAKVYLPFPTATEYILQAARGLHYAHIHKIVHRDVKPANLYLTNSGTVKLLDLGLSKELTDASQSFATQTGIAVGTPHYISPEQACGEKNVDGRADIYSLGATFYHFLTGTPPYSAQTSAAIVMKHLNEQLPNPQDIRPEIPDAVVQVLQKMMAKETRHRYRDCGELIVDLELVGSGRTPKAESLAAGLSNVALRGAKNLRRGSMRKTTAAPVATKPKVPPALAFAGLGAALLIFGAIFFWQRKNNDVANAKLPAEPPGSSEKKVAEEKTAPAVKAPEVAPNPPPVAPESKTPAVQVASPDEPPLTEWEQIIAMKQPNAQVQAVLLKLKEKNPGFVDKGVEYAFRDGKVVKLFFSGVGVKDISPVRALRGLEELRCSGAVADHNQRLVRSILGGLEDIRGLKLKVLDISATTVGSLKPVSGMPLKVLVMKDTLIADLASLKGVPLEGLYLDRTPVEDLTPLSGNKLLGDLNAPNARITTLEQVVGCPMFSLNMSGNPISDLKPLSKNTTTFFLQLGETKIESLEGLESAPLQELYIYKTKVSSLAPVANAPLQVLIAHDTQIEDLSILKGKPLRSLHCRNTKVKDFTPLIGTPLKKLSCDFDYERDAPILRQIKSLETINDKSAREVLK